MKKDLKTGVVYGKLLLVNVSPILRKGATALGTIILSADSTCDLGDELQQRYHVNYYPFHVILEDKLYGDGIDLQPDDIYAHVSAGGGLPKTAAVNLADYVRMFTELSAQNDFVIHICISLDFSCCYQNAKLAAADFDNVYVVDSRNLSTGHGHVVLRAAELAESGMSPQDIVDALNAFAPAWHRTRSSRRCRS